MNFNIFINSLCVFSSRHSELICCCCCCFYPSTPDRPLASVLHSSRTSRLPQCPRWSLTSSYIPPPHQTLAHPTQKLLLPTAIAVARIPSGSVQIFTHFIYIYICAHIKFSGDFPVYICKDTNTEICFAARAYNTGAPAAELSGVSRKCCSIRTVTDG